MNFSGRGILTRMVVYLLSLLSLALVFIAVIYLIGFIAPGNQAFVHLSLTSVIVAVGLSFLFQPFKYYFNRVTENVLYQKNYDINDFIANIGHILLNTHDLEGMLQRTGDEIVATLDARKYLFVVFNDGLEPTIVGNRSKLSLHDINAIADQATNFNQPISIDAIKSRSRQLFYKLLRRRVAIILPLKRGDALIGFLLVGDNRFQKYNYRDYEAIRAISDEINIAIQNLLSIEITKKLNHSLQRKINQATQELRQTNQRLVEIDNTKNEFVGIASHQLRTPLTSIKGYISMLLEGDAGQLNPTQRQFLEEAFNSSERMVRLISDFLNISRLETGKFSIEKTECDITQIVAEEIKAIQPMVKASRMSIVYKQPTAMGVIIADEAKLRQVVMNFIDNAVYYSKPRSIINVSLKQTGQQIEFKVIDQGIGVPKDEQAKLFSKFYRADNARTHRPDGSGVGLFLARKIIDGHNGQIIFKSKENKGSTFGFKIPVK